MKFSIAFLFLFMCFVQNTFAQDCDCKPHDVAVTLSECNGTNFDLSETVNLEAGQTAKYFEECTGAGVLETEILVCDPGNNDGNCIIDFDPDNDVNNIIFVEVTTGTTCDSIIEVTLSVLPVPTPNLQSDGNLHLCGTETEELSLTQAYTSYLWEDNSTNSTLTVSLAGTYIVTVTESNGCTGSTSIVVNASVNPTFTIESSGDFHICGSESETLNTNPTFISYLWNTSSTSPTIDIMSAGAYSVTVTDANGCTGSSAIVVTSSAGASPIIQSGSGDFNLCGDETDVLTTTVSFTSYLWQDASTGFSFTVENSGTYSVTVTDVQGCTGVTSIMVTSSTVPSPTIDSNDDFHICGDETETLSLSENYDGYLWSDASTNSTLDVNSSGTYAVTVTDVQGCTGISSVMVTQSSVSSIMIETTGDFHLCGNETETLSLSTSFSGYLWQDNSTQSTLTVNSSGTYAVTVTDAQGCTGESSVMVTSSAIPVPILQSNGDLHLCGNETEILSTVSSYNSYLWNDNSTNQTLSVNASGTYSITVTDGSGCTGIASIMVNSSVPPTANATNNGPLCAGELLMLQGGGAGASGTYDWTGPNGFTSNTQNPQIPNSEVSDSGPYNLTVTDVNGCTGTASTSVVVNPVPTIAVDNGNTNGPTSCAGSDGQISLIFTDVPNGDQTVTWNGSGSGSQIIAVSGGIGVITGLTAGAYNDLAITILGCSSIENPNVSLADPNGPTIAISGFTNPTECGGSNGTISIDFTGVPNGTHTINYGGGSVEVMVTNNKGDMTDLSAGPYNNLTIVVANCTSNTDESQLLSDPNGPTIAISGFTNPTECGGSNGTISIDFTGVPNGTHTINYGGGSLEVMVTNNKGDMTGLSAGPYNNLTIVVANCTSNTDQSQSLEDPESPTCSASSNSPLCEGSTIILTSNTDANNPTYSWTGPNSFTSSDPNPTINNATPINAGTYSLTVTKDGCDCVITTEVLVHPEINISNVMLEGPLCNGQPSGSISFDVTGGSGGYNYMWSNGGNTNPLNDLVADDYFVTINDDLGVCSLNPPVFTLVEPLPINIANVTIAKSCDNENNGSIHLTTNGGIGELTFSWSNGEMTEDIEDIGPGSYTVTIQDENLCELVKNYTVESWPEINGNISGDFSYCENGSTVICASDNINYSYLWSNTEVTRCITIEDEGFYSVVISQNNPGQVCTETTGINVDEIPLPVGSINSNDMDTPPGGDTGDATICLGSEALLTAIASNYTNAELNYNWDNGLDTESISVGSDGFHVVTISENMSGKSCSDIDSLEVTVIAPPSVSNLKQLNSTNEVGSLMFFGADIATGTNSIEEYQWFVNPAGDIQNGPPEEQLEIIFNEFGEKDICLTVIDDYTCASPIQCIVKVVINEGDCVVESVSADQNIVCPNDEVMITGTAKRSNSASKIVSYEWIINDIPQGEIIVNSTDQPFIQTDEFSFVDAGDKKIEFRIVDDGFPVVCNSSNSVTIEVLPRPIVNIVEETLVGCAEVSIEINYDVTYDLINGGMKQFDLDFVSETGSHIDDKSTNGENSGKLNLEFSEGGIWTLVGILDPTGNYCSIINEAQDEFDVTILPELEAIDVALNCSDDGVEFSYTFEIIGGDSTYMIEDGVNPDDVIEEIDGKWIYTSGIVLNGSGINVIISDGSSCSNLEVASLGENNVCECGISETTGAIQIDNGNICESDTLFFEHIFSGNIPPELADTLEFYYYIVDSLPFDPLGTAHHLGSTKNKFITINDAAIEVDSTYSIIPVLGFPDINQGVNLGLTSCLSFLGDSKEFTFFSNPSPSIIGPVEICANTSNEVLEAGNLIGGFNNNVLWNVVGVTEVLFFPSADEEQVYVSFPDSLFPANSTVTIELFEEKLYSGLDDFCTSSTSIEIFIVDEAAPDQGEIIWWPGDILVSTVEDACYHWGFTDSNGDDHDIDDGNDDRFMYVPNGISEVDHSDNPENIYWVKIFFKDGGQCDINDVNCVTRTYYNSDGPPGLKLGYGDTNEFLIYPNPSESMFNIRVRGERGGNYQLDVFTQMGQRIETNTFEKNYWTLARSIDLANYEAGMYYFVFTNDVGERKIFKVMKTL